ncbi:maltodextrin glucosidase [Shigella flexneri]|nr:maltodextrin glucosidase [Shigella flexneri]
MMLNAWHLPVPPFVKQSKDQLLITLWLTGEDPPQRIMLRTEHDNEEMSVPMHKQRSQPQPGVTAWRAAIDLSSGQPRRRYSFKLLWHDRQRWFTPQGFSRMPPARLEQFAVDVPDIGPQWAADQIFYQIFPDRFARSLPREAEQDHVYYHHAAGQEIILRDWDEPVTAQAGGSTFYGGDLDGISEKLPYLKKLGVTALYLNPVFKAPSVHKYDTEDYRHVDPQFGGDGALLRLRHNTQQLGMRLVLDGVFNHSGDSHAWFDRHNLGTGGACHNSESPWRDWYSFSDDGTALDWLGYASLTKLDYQSESLVNEIYRGEDSIVRHWLKAPWNMDGWRLDVVHMLGEAGGARNNMQHVAGITEAAKETQPEAYIVGEHFGDARQWLQADVEDAAMNYRGFTFPLWDFLPIPTSLMIRSKLTPKPVWPGWIITAQGFLINNNYVCLISSIATILRDLKRCSVGILRACRWRWSGCSPGLVYRAFITVMKWDWMVKTIRFAVNRSPGRWKSRIRRYSRCTGE